MCNKKLISFVLVLTTVLLSSFAFASDDPASLFIDIDIPIVGTLNNDYAVTKKIGEITTYDNSLDFSIYIKDDIDVKFILEDAQEIFENKLDELSKDKDLNKKLSLDIFYNDSLFIYSFYKNMNSYDNNDIRWAIIHNLVKYILIDSKKEINEEPILTNDEAEIFTNEVLNIKTTKVISDNSEQSTIDDERLEIITDIFYSSLKTEVDINNIVFVEFINNTVENETNYYIPEVDDDNNSNIDLSEGYEVDERDIEIDILDEVGKENVIVDNSQVWDNENVKQENSQSPNILNNQDEKIDIYDIVKKDFVYVDYKNGQINPLGIVVKDAAVSFEKEKKIIDKLEEDLNKEEMENITNHIADSSKLMVSSNGKLLISKKTDAEKTSDEISKFYKPVEVNLVFVEK